MSNETPPAAPTPPVSYAPLSEKDQRLWATLVHIGGVVVSFWAALIGYLVLKDRGDFVREHTKTALNFQLTILIAYFVSSFLMIAFIGFLLLPAVWVVSIIFSIMAAMAANKGEAYVYPSWAAIKFLK